MIKFDYHIHTSHSVDCRTPMEEMIEHAISLGLEEIAITDHVDFSYPGNDVLSPPGVAANIFKMRAMREKYAGDISVLSGVEFNLRPDSANIIRQIAAAHNFDIIIGSVHELGAVDFSFPEYCENRTKREAHGLYLKTVFDAVTACDSWDILGHLGYIERYGDYGDKSLARADFSDIIDEILKHVIKSDKGIEINTSGYRYALKRPHPNFDIIARYKELGGEIFTVGSDAHSTAAMAVGFEEIHTALRNLGIKYIARFERRRPVFVKI